MIFNIFRYADKDMLKIAAILLIISFIAACISQHRKEARINRIIKQALIEHDNYQQDNQ